MPAPRTIRRRFLSYLAGLLLLVLGVLVAIPAIGYLLAPLRRRMGTAASGAGFQDLCPLTDLALDQWNLRPLDVLQQDGWKKTRVRHSVWVRREGHGDQAIIVLSPICPHLGCPVSWHLDRTEFICPCHGGTFDAAGQHIAGPPPRSLDPLEFEIRDGHLWVRWQDFKIGVADCVPVSV
jgi:menaquinol-cytochrome c reductase iron-sulfur subunit